MEWLGLVFDTLFIEFNVFCFTITFWQILVFDFLMGVLFLVFSIFK